MFVEGVSEKGSKVAVCPEAISAIREKGSRSWVCIYGQWVCLDMSYSELLRLLEPERQET